MRIANNQEVDVKSAHMLRRAVEMSAAERTESDPDQMIVGDYIAVAEVMDRDGDVGLLLLTDANPETHGQMVNALMGRLLQMALHNAQHHRTGATDE